MPYVRALGYMLWFNFILGLNFILFWFWTCSVMDGDEFKTKENKS